MKLPHFDQSVMIRIRPPRHSFWDKIKMHWDSIYEGLQKDHKDVLDWYCKFTGQEFPETLLSVSLFNNKYLLFTVAFFLDGILYV